jgi:hypothetical protein
MNARVLVLLFTAVTLAGCAPAVYQLTAMPRDSGATFEGTIVDSRNGDGTVTIALGGRTFSGVWTRTAQQGTDYVISGTGGGWGGRAGPYGGGFGGGFATASRVDPGATWVALLKAPDGSGLRCDMATDGNGRGGGTCRDDAGKIYDIQFRPTKG